MTSLEIRGPIELEEPSLVLAIGGWVDGGQVASKIGEHLAGLGGLAAEFRPDEIFDYQSHRPTLELVGGTTEGTCVPRVAVGEACIETGACAPGSTCVDEVCTANVSSTCE